MNTRKANGLFLIIVLIYIAMSLFMQFTPMYDVVRSNLALNLILSELVIWLPALLFMAAGRVNPLRFCRIKRVHFSTLPMTVLFTMLCSPVITLANAISLLFVDNTVLGMSGSMMGLPFPVMLFMMAIYGPFAEEFVFRGVLYQSYRAQGNAFRAALLSALLFGLMHMNVNQTMYAFVMGVLAALLIEATDSLWTTFLFHFGVNAASVVTMYAMQLLPEGFYENLMEASTEYAASELLPSVCMYVLLAVVCTPLAMCALAWMAGREGRLAQLKNVWPGRKFPSGRMITVPLILAVFLCLGMIVLELVM